MIFIKINNIPVKALLDSGSKKTIISKKYANLCKLNLEKNQDNLNKLYTANGQEVNIIGTAIADIVVQELRMPVVFQVVDRLSHDVILGHRLHDRTSHKHLSA